MSGGIGAWGDEVNGGAVLGECYTNTSFHIEQFEKLRQGFVLSYYIF